MRRDDSGTPPDRPSGPRPPGPDAGRGEDDAHLRDLQRARQARVAKALVVLAILVILIVFIVSNSQPVKVKYVFVTRYPRLIWVMFACAVLGGIAGYLIGRPGKQIRLHRRDEGKRT